MTTKTFRAPSMLEALKLIQADLGTKAVIVSVRQVPDGPVWAAWKKPVIEVIATTTLQSKTPETGQPSQTALPTASVSSAVAPQTSAVKVPPHAVHPQAISAYKPKQVSKKANPAIHPEEAFLEIKGSGSHSSQTARSSQPSSRLKTPPLPAQGEAPQRQIMPFLTYFKSKKDQQGPQNSKKPAEKNTDPVKNTPALPNTAKSNLINDVVQANNEESSASENTSVETLRSARQSLLLQGVDPRMVEKVIRTTRETLGPSALENEERVHLHLQKQLEAILHTESWNSASHARIICLVGTSGSGKTSTCMHLAANFSQSQNLRVVWICADTVRTGAITEARTYAGSLGISFYLAYTPQDLLEAVNNEKEADVILVDTPGCNPYNENKIVELGNYLTRLPERCTFLVTSATTKEPDMIQMASAFGALNLRGIICTKMDETRTFGSIYNLACRSQLPLAYFCSGKELFKDFHVASKEMLISTLLGESLIW